MPAASRSGSGAVAADVAQVAAATLMYRESAEAAGRIERQLRENAAPMRSLAQALRQRPPRFVVTCARGSSDHAATYAKYLIETHTRLVTASAAPSIASLYGIEHDLRDCLFLAISQSGRSPDLLRTVDAARRNGATVVALCNDAHSPLCAAAHHAVPLWAGPELSVAATKSFMTTLSALAHLVAEWSDDAVLLAGTRALPAELQRAAELDWSEALPLLTPAAHLYVISRGLGLSIAQEAALKAKETCGLHAESYSGAEVRHGPFALLGEHFPALILAQDDATRPGLAQLATDLTQRRVPVLLAGATAPGAIALPSITGHPALAPIRFAASLYPLLARLSIARGHDPDRPPHLRKVTETV